LKSKIRSILLTGDSGLDRLKGLDLSQDLAFTNTKQKIPFNDDGRKVLYWGWDPCDVLVLGDAVDSKGESRTSMQHNGNARKCFLGKH